MDYNSLKVELLCSGVKVPDEIWYRKGGAGPAAGRYFQVPSGAAVNIPVQGKFIERSPFRLESVDGKWALYRDDDFYCEMTPIPQPEFYKMKTTNGIPMWKIALVHGTDCLSTTVDQTCIYWRDGRQCKFCGIELSLEYDTTIKRKSPEQLVEVTRATKDEGRANHMTLTIGSQDTPAEECAILSETVRSIKEQFDIPIHVQTEPVEKMHMEELFASGVDTIGIHIESFDKDIMKKICPGKSGIYYDGVWQSAVDIFGRDQVSSFVIAGLGETDENIIQGCEMLSSIGIVPFVVPLRPIAKTPLADWSPPLPERMIPLYRRIGEIMKRNGVSPLRNRAGCVRCGCCSAISEFF